MQEYISAYIWSSMVGVMDAWWRRIQESGIWIWWKIARCNYYKPKFSHCEKQWSLFYMSRLDDTTRTSCFIRLHAFWHDYKRATLARLIFTVTCRWSVAISQTIIVDIKASSSTHRRPPDLSAHSTFSVVSRHRTMRRPTDILWRHPIVSCVQMDDLDDVMSMTTADRCG